MDDSFEFPDMEDLAKQMEDAMTGAQKAMEDLPEQMGDLEQVMGSLSALMGNLPAQMEELSDAMNTFEEQHEANSAALAGDPDWAFTAEIRVGEVLHVRVRAAFDFGKLMDALQSTQVDGFEALVGGIVAGTGGEMDSGTMDQMMEQLQKGRSIALVEDVEVLACNFQGAPGDATETLQLSPEGNIPLVMSNRGLGFEFAPLLTIRNQWEHASIPTFAPMGEEIVVPGEYFLAGEAFNLRFEPRGQEDALEVTLSFEPLT